MKWYIGQRIVAIKDHSQVYFKRGDEFQINGLRMAPCGCGKVEIDIGLSDDRVDGVICVKCGKGSIYTGALFYHECCFAPLEHIEEAIHNLLEESLTVKQI